VSSYPHSLDTPTISLVQGNTGANGTFTITVTGPSTFSLGGSTGNGAWTTGGVVTLPGALSLSQALSASIADVTKIATALGAVAPSLDPAHLAGTLADIAVLTRVANALDVVARYQINAATLLLLAAAPPLLSQPDGRNRLSRHTQAAVPAGQAKPGPRAMSVTRKQGQALWHQVETTLAGEIETGQRKAASVCRPSRNWCKGSASAGSRSARRQAEGIAAAKARGVYKGRKAKIDAAVVRKLRDGEKLGPAEIARKLGIGRASVYRVLGKKAA
jgi:hypothetical protein